MSNVYSILTFKLEYYSIINIIVLEEAQKLSKY